MDVSVGGIAEKTFDNFKKITPALVAIDMYPFYWTNPVKGVFV